MSDESVIVDKPGHPFHGRHGMVISRRGEQYTVEFHEPDHFPNYAIETFTGRELRAVVRVRVRV